MPRLVAILAAALALTSFSAASDEVREPAAPTAVATASATAEVFAAEQFQIFSQDVPARSPEFLASLGLGAPTAAPLQQACCKICSKGKACGNTCISRDKACHVGPGCACDG